MTKTVPILDALGRVGFHNEDLSLTLADIIEEAEIFFNSNGADDTEIVFAPIGLTPYDLILRKKRPIEFQKVTGGFQRIVTGIITLDQVKKEAQALPNFDKYGFGNVKVFWTENWNLCIYISE